MMPSQTNEQASESLIEEALVGSTIWLLKKSLLSFDFPSFRNAVCARHIPGGIFAFDECPGSRHAAEPVSCCVF